jgi:hypothetical protein
MDVTVALDAALGKGLESAPEQPFQPPSGARHTTRGWKFVRRYSLQAVDPKRLVAT